MGLNPAIDNFPKPVNAKQYDAVMPALSRDGRFPPQAVATVAKPFVELKILPAVPDMTKYLTELFLPPAP